MKSRKFRQDPGANPGDRSFVHSSREKKGSRKAAQLCRQVQKSLGLALSGECGDELLQSLCVQSVTPAPDASRLMVTLIAPVKGAENVAEILRRLDALQSWLRREVAAAIVRKRAPELAFRLIPADYAPSDEEVQS